MAICYTIEGAYKKGSASPHQSGMPHTAAAAAELARPPEPEKPTEHFFQFTESLRTELTIFFNSTDVDPNDDLAVIKAVNQKNPSPAVLKALITITLASSFDPKPKPPRFGEPLSPENLDSAKQSFLDDLATHIATRIKELILGQGISAEDFSSLVYAGRPDDESLSQCTEEQLFIIVSKQFESINENFQPTQPQEGLPIERKLQNLLEKTEFLDLVGILTHLTPYTPNNDTAHVMLDFLVMALSSLDYQQPPLAIEETPETQTTPHTPELAGFLQRHQQQQQQPA
jgi:hypothetical protein